MRSPRSRSEETLQDRVQERRDSCVTGIEIALQSNSRREFPIRLAQAAGGGASSGGKSVPTFDNSRDLVQRDR